ncbi:hypothetical protein AL527_14430 [Pseudomonas fulva]|uniref:hypothetical protein n=1 Tax=Pseudomonas fulva TaxID=47880 RepID=UPI000CE9835E|nr:hypothetical protein [Pseudomonas fulva]AVF56262.1 hypothetical protein AL527_14430 [Pseudomonas fulva]
MQIQKFDRSELKARQEQAKQAYAHTIDGVRVDDLTKTPHPTTGVYPQRTEVGAVCKLQAFDLFDYLNKFTVLQEDGYVRYNGVDGMLGESAEAVGIFIGYMTKPEAAQKEDIKKINARVEAEYSAELERANAIVRERMIEQLTADRVEAARVAAAVAEDEARKAIEAEVDAALGIK